MEWQPTASLAVLAERAKFLRDIRIFFEKRQIMEVETPLLCQGVATDPCLQSFEIDQRYLQTSPEFSMKRLLAAGSGAIYSLGKAFRKEEAGKKHNPEFTMLEWYRPGWDHYRLITEVDELFQTLLGSAPAQISTYQACFEEKIGINPHLASVEQLRYLEILQSTGVAGDQLDRDDLLDLLFSHYIEPHLGQSAPAVIIDFPASGASLARTRQVGSIAVAERFEFYFKGMELANGYHELTCGIEQKERFERDAQKRKAKSLAAKPIDQRLLAALQAGLPDCAGVALGVDRLLMLKLGLRDISQVLAFAWQEA